MNCFFYRLTPNLICLPFFVLPDEFLFFVLFFLRKDLFCACNPLLSFFLSLPRSFIRSTSSRFRSICSGVFFSFQLQRSFCKTFFFFLEFRLGKNRMLADTIASRREDFSDEKLNLRDDAKGKKTF